MNSLLDKLNIKKHEVVQISKQPDLYSFLYLIKNKNIITFEDSDYVDISLGGERKNSVKPKLLEKFRDPGFILKTSGTTGEPKFVLYSFNKFLNKFKNVKYNPIKTIMFMDIDHIGGMDVYFSVISRGGSVIFPKDKTPNTICKLIEENEIQFISLPPTFLNLILISELHKKYNLSSLKTINFGSEIMPNYLLTKLKNIFPFCEFKQTFGTSETGTLKVSRNIDDPLFIKIENSKVIDKKLYIKSKYGMKGYLNLESPLTADGYFPTGDIVEEKNGYVKIIGREKNIINIGGEKFYPAEIENLILQLPNIKDVVVYSEPNLIVGNILVANVVLKSDDNYSKSIKEFLATKVEKYKIPSKILKVDKIDYSSRMKKIRN